MLAELIHRALIRYRAILSDNARPLFTKVDLEERVARAKELLKSCHLCAHECHVDRPNGERGVCNVGIGMRVASSFEHYGEEAFLVPSYTIFFESCNLSCLFCQNWDISRATGETPSHMVTEKQLAGAIDNHAHCCNVNFVGGEPTPYLPFILETLRHVTIDIPVIWNSNMYLSPQGMDLLDGVVDLYLTDFKFGNDTCARNLANVNDYWQVVAANHARALESGEMVIRHLMLPNHFECCTRPILEHIAEEFGDRVVVNLMDQYRPAYRAVLHGDLNRRVTASEFNKGLSLAAELQLNFIS